MHSLQIENFDFSVKGAINYFLQRTVSQLGNFKVGLGVDYICLIRT